MKHTVTLDESDLREAVRKHIEEAFPGYTAARFRFSLSEGVIPTAPMQAYAEVDLGRPTEPKD